MLTEHDKVINLNKVRNLEIQPCELDIFIYLFILNFFFLKLNIMKKKRPRLYDFSNGG